jgi:uncharacterized protein DUF4105
MLVAMLRIAVALALVLGIGTGVRAAQAQPATETVAAGAAAEQAPPLPVVELYTFGVGSYLVEKFGHAALCLRYPRRGDLDVCFNYGTTDFSDPIGMVWGFLRGKARFWVSVDSPSGMVRHYKRLDRSIWVQRLPLSPDQARAVEAKLLADTADPNWHYAYHHFYDNCSTRVRDTIDLATAGAMKSETSLKPGPGDSYRGLARHGFAEQTWLLMTSDLILGRPADRPPNRWESMFLPQYLSAEVETRFGVKPQVIYTRRGPDFSQDPGLGGRQWFVLLGLALGVPLALARYRGRLHGLALGWALWPLVFLGLVIWGIAIVTPLAEGRLNEAILVFMPTDLALAFMAERWRRGYARIRLVLLAVASLMAAIGVFHQPLMAAMLMVFPTMLAIAAVPRRLRAARPAAAAPEAAQPTSPTSGESDGAAA